MYSAVCDTVNCTNRSREESLPLARNSSMVDMCIRGEGVAMVGKSTHGVERFDVWNTPSMQPYHFRNDGRDLFVRLSYSNAPLLERLEVHYVNTKPELTDRADLRGLLVQKSEQLELF